MIKILINNLACYDQLPGHLKHLQFICHIDMFRCVSGRFISVLTGKLVTLKAEDRSPMTSDQ